jgi:hypothetical protein
LILDTAAIAFVAMYVTGLFRKISSAIIQGGATREMTLLFLLVVTPLIALAGMGLNLLPMGVDTIREALVLGFAAVPVSIGMYEGTKTAVFPPKSTPTPTLTPPLAPPVTPALVEPPSPRGH